MTQVLSLNVVSSNIASSIRRIGEEIDEIDGDARALLRDAKVHLQEAQAKVKAAREIVQGQS